MAGSEGKQQDGEVSENNVEEDDNSSINSMPSLAYLIFNILELLQGNEVLGQAKLFISERFISGFDDEGKHNM